MNYGYLHLCILARRFCEQVKVLNPNFSSAFTKTAKNHVMVSLETLKDNFLMSDLVYL